MQQVNEMAAKGTTGFLVLLTAIGMLCLQNPMCWFMKRGWFTGQRGIIDPPRDEVFDAVAQCKTAGIVPVIITGDHPLTAKTIAQRVGILQSESELVITGKELAALDE